MIRLLGNALSYLLCAVAFFGSCTDPGNVTDFSNIADPMERWNAYHVRDYTIRQRRLCFCPDGGIPFEITIRQDTIVAAANSISRDPVPSADWVRFRTVEELFQLVRTIDPESVASFQVSYDSRFGFPSRVYVDPWQDAFDEQYGYVTELVALRLAE
jgi:hypothetical protein